MAITLSAANVNQASCEDSTYTLTTSTPNAVKGMVMRLYADGSTTVIAEVEHAPDAGTTDTYTFEINSILKYYIPFSFHTLNGSSGTITQLVKVGAISFHEVLNNGTIQASGYDTTHKVYKMAFDNFEALTSLNPITVLPGHVFDLGSTGSSSRRFMTNMPDTIGVYSSQECFLSVMRASYGASPTFTGLQEFYILYYNSAGAVVGSSTVAIEPTLRANINAATPNRHDIFVLKEVMNPAYAKMTVRVRDISGGTTRSEIKTFVNLDYDCDKVRGQVIHWQNEFGVQDSFCFAGEFNRTIKSKFGTYEKVSVGDVAFGSRFEYQYELSTERVTQDTVIWLAGMMRSQNVCLQYGNDYIPIILESDEISDFSEFDPRTLYSIKFRLAKIRKG